MLLLWQLNLTLVLAAKDIYLASTEMGKYSLNDNGQFFVLLWFCIGGLLYLTFSIQPVIKFNINNYPMAWRDSNPRPHDPKQKVLPTRPGIAKPD